jgi:hypothetical protein
VYAAWVGANDIMLLAGWYCHGEALCISALVELLIPSFKLYGAGCAGNMAEYIQSRA